RKLVCPKSPDLNRFSSSGVPKISVRGGCLCSRYSSESLSKNRSILSVRPDTGWTRRDLELQLSGSNRFEGPLPLGPKTRVRSHSEGATVSAFDRDISELKKTVLAFLATTSRKSLLSGKNNGGSSTVSSNIGR